MIKESFDSALSHLQSVLCYTCGESLTQDEYDALEQACDAIMYDLRPRVEATVPSINPHDHSLTFGEVSDHTHGKELYTTPMFDMTLEEGHEPQLREWSGGLELSKSLHLTPEEVKKSSEMFGVLPGCISKKFMMNHILGIDDEEMYDVGYKGQEGEDVSLCYAPYIPNLTDVGCDLAEVCKGKGSLIKYLPGCDEDKYDNAMKVVK